ncbi:hypothetical protein [Pontibacter flavimaris]|uniref:hypothetical protein n=1 Tax=Pontibacter flavimaris TaxID=1797110 RepID=UPI0011150DC9|nr:hypothetical protein [Pontibacter flavimaris]
MKRPYYLLCLYFILAPILYTSAIPLFRTSLSGTTSAADFLIRAGHTLYFILAGLYFMPSLAQASACAFHSRCFLLLEPSYLY